jgi:hypothetical protein
MGIATSRTLLRGLQDGSDSRDRIDGEVVVFGL